MAGGGAVANRRVPALLDAGADVLLVSPEVTGSLEDLAQAGRIHWSRRRYAAGDIDGAWLVCACTSDPAVNASHRRGGGSPADLVCPRRRRESVAGLDPRVRRGR